jgi:hypothetical protein
MPDAPQAHGALQRHLPLGDRRAGNPFSHSGLPRRPRPQPLLLTAHLVCSGQVVTPASQDSPAVVEGTSTSDVLLFLKTGLRYVPKWKTEG